LFVSILDRFRLDGQVAVVTGSGRGIGAATALAFADAGADVVIAARSQDEIEAVADDARGRGVRALAVPCDVLDAGSRTELLRRAVDEFGRLDILVNNAGGWGPTDSLSLSPDDFDACFQFNVTSAFALSQSAAPMMVEGNGHGSIVNISSVAGTFSQPGFLAYGTAKAALSFMTGNLAQDFAPKVRVNAIAVGSVLTDALKGFMTPELEEGMLARTPMGRLGAPDDIAACALYLASPASSYVTGEVFGVNGGITQSQVSMPKPRL
jgi:7-alpha-hydroxysteroid dehydrogenase